jgi:HAD superfamily hydrolase (TIGR01509 family)
MKQRTKILFIGIGALIIYRVIALTLLSPTTNTLVNIDPATTVFAFDLHDVMVRPSSIERAKIFLDSPYKKTIFKLVLNPYFIYQAVRLSYSIGLEPMLTSLDQQYPQLKIIEPTIIEFFNAQKPIAKTIDLIKKLKEQGFRLYLLSNIGKKTFEQFYQKYPDIFSDFDGFYFSSPENGYRKKPDPVMFEQFLKQFDLQADNVIFVDDLSQNIAAAKSLGIKGIQFTSPLQLRMDLKRSNIIALFKPLPQNSTVIC